MRLSCQPVRGSETDGDDNLLPPLLDPLLSFSPLLDATYVTSKLNVFGRISDSTFIIFCQDILENNVKERLTYKEELEE